MDSLSDVVAARPIPSPHRASAYKESRKEIDLSLVRSATRDKRDEDSVKLNFGELYNGLSITAKKIVDEINELLSAKLPDGVQSLDPSDVTPEATADRIVTGATGFFGVFAAQNPDLDPEALLDEFMKTIRSGIERGYGEAFETLQGLGAFDIEGVQAGVEQTKRLIDEKLAAYEAEMRKKISGDVEETAAQSTTEEIVASAGATIDLRA